MKDRLFIILSIVLIVAALIGLNAASFIETERTPDKEEEANRSTYNVGATGTRAFYDFLRESRFSVARWQEKPKNLLDKTGAQRPKSFVVIGELRRRFEKREIEDLHQWVADGGRLIIIDRFPQKELLPASDGWQVSARYLKPQSIVGDSSNVNEMTTDVTAARPIQPGILTENVVSVMPSKFAFSIDVSRSNEISTVQSSPLNGIGSAPAPMSKPKTDKKLSYEEALEKIEKEKIVGVRIPNSKQPESVSFAAPIISLTTENSGILADYVYGDGRIVFLSDPYIVSNGGISLVDNLRLATNLVDNGGLIAFDEFHQGYGAAGNPLLEFFAGTPVPAIVGQIVLLLIVAMWTQGRRFARPIPLPNPDRRSKLEYVAAMAELQRNTKSFDLAIENIYTRFRRRLISYAGVDKSAPRHAVVKRIVERAPNINAAELETVMHKCEDAIHGEKINAKQALELIGKLRDFEQELNLRNAIFQLNR